MRDPKHFEGGGGVVRGYLYLRRGRVARDLFLVILLFKFKNLEIFRGRGPDPLPDTSACD